MSPNPTTNQRMFKQSVPAQVLEKKIDFFEKLGRPQPDCFFGTTKNQEMFNYIGPQMIAPSTKPPPMPHIETKFTGKTSYHNVFESDLHQEQSSGQEFVRKHKEERARTRELGKYHRSGQFSSGKHPF